MKSKGPWIKKICTQVSLLGLFFYLIFMSAVLKEQGKGHLPIVIIVVFRKNLPIQMDSSI